MQIVLDIKKNIDQNAQTYFEKAKQARHKMEGAKKALAVSLKKLDEEKKKSEDQLDAMKDRHAKLASVVKRKEEWYEKFRWFISSEGFLLVGGRDATTNEILVKKHTNADDVVFHTDMAGSPFFIVKTEGKKPGPTTLQEGADATLCFSRAWKLGLLTTPTFWVTPDQVTKEANSGEYLTKGAFMIRGKTNYITPLTKCAIGLLPDGRIMSGPTAAVRKHCEKMLELVQKDAKTSETAKLIKKKLGGGELDEIIRALPPGNVGVKD
jgi:predicted ribosome quality control (RQC) complex YloA/Tae2 family protein